MLKSFFKNIIFKERLLYSRETVNKMLPCRFVFDWKEMKLLKLVCDLVMKVDFSYQKTKITSLDPDFIRMEKEM